MANASGKRKGLKADASADRREPTADSPTRPAGQATPQRQRSGDRDNDAAHAEAMELIHNVLLATLQTPSRLAVDLEVSLKEIKRLSELAAYRELKLRGLTMKEICQRIDVSMGKVGLLSRHLKDHFSRPDAEFGLSRRILALLWSGPQTEARLGQALAGVDAHEVAAAISELVEQGHIIPVKGRTLRYKLSDHHYRLIREPWMAKVDALHQLFSSVTDAIRARFFQQDERAFARTLIFRVRPEDIPRLRELYEKQLFPLVNELDARATESPGADSVPVNLSVLWAPEGSPEGDLE